MVSIARMSSLSSLYYYRLAYLEQMSTLKANLQPQVQTIIPDKFLPVALNVSASQAPNSLLGVPQIFFQDIMQHFAEYFFLSRTGQKDSARNHLPIQ